MTLNQKERRIIKEIFDEKQASWQKKLVRMPLLGPFLAGFGLVSTFYGFEKILDRTVLVEKPEWLLGVGIAVLLLTGAYYRKL